MIEDAVLERLLFETADELTIPDDGPGRILDERDELLRVHTPRLPRLTGGRILMATAAAAAIIVAGTVTALAAGHHPAKTPTSLHGSGASIAASPPVTAAAANGAQQATGAGGILSQGSGAPGSAGSSVYGESSGGSTNITNGTGAALQGPAPAGGTSPNEVPALPTKVIKTASVSLQVAVKGLSAAMTRLGNIAGGQGGFIQSSGTTSAATGQPANGTATIRVPVANFSAALNQVEALGIATSVTTSGQDVTAQYVDLQARLQSAEDARTRFQQILTQASSIPDILSVEQQISDLETQIEQLQGQLNVMDDQTSFSTITVTVSEASPKPTPAVAPSPPNGISKAWSHARHSFAHGLESVVAASGGFAVFIIFLLVAIGLARLAWVQGRRRLL
jgi:hypothetical protein